MQEHFKTYESIANDNNKRTIEYYRELIKENPALGTDWYATEKIHGTNFSLITDGTNIEYFQRTIPITDGFMGFRDWLGNIPEKAKMISRNLKKPIQIYFEFCGEGIINPKCNPIKYFSDGKKAFVSIETRDVETDRFLDFDPKFYITEILDNMYRVPVIAPHISFEEGLLLSTRFKSIVAAEHGVDTWAEGIVLKPIKDQRLPDGSRMILKKVDPAFAENQGKKAPVDVKESPDEAVIALIKDADTPMRLGKVAAKFGIQSSDRSRFGTLMIEYAKDIKGDIKGGAEISENVIKKVVTDTVKGFFNS
jgi:Rnl2 family RNA ligase